MRPTGKNMCLGDDSSHCLHGVKQELSRRLNVTFGLLIPGKAYDNLRRGKFADSNNLLRDVAYTIRDAAE